MSLHASAPPAIVVPPGEIRPITRAPARERWSWAMYDFSNTIFSMNVATLYFSVWIVNDLGASSLSYSVAAAVASLLVVISIPFLGAVSDARRRRKPWVVGFTVLSCIACAAIGVLGSTTLPVVGEGVVSGAMRTTDWAPTAMALLPVLVAYVLANFAYQAAQPFYNAMLTELVPAEERGRLSGIGAAVGYVGSIVGVMLISPFFTGGMPVIGQLGDELMSALRSVIPFTGTGGRVATFVPTALLFLLFSLPLFLFCRDHDPAPRGTPIPWRKAFDDVVGTVRDARKYPGALRFIVSSLIYQDAVGTIVTFMALYAVKAMDFAEGAEVTLFVVLTVPAVLGSYIAGVLVDRIGAKRTLQATIGIWIVLLLAMVMVPSQQAFWIVGLMIGLNFGGVNAAERPMLLSLIPDREAGRYFSLMLLSARVASMIGPLIWGLTITGFEPSFGTGFAYRAAVVTVALMFAGSLLVLRGVPDRRERTPGGVVPG